MLRCQSPHLANTEIHSELKKDPSGNLPLKAEYGDGFDQEKLWLLGNVFDGGGLVPHEDEVPGLSLLRKERQEIVENADKAEEGNSSIGPRSTEKKTTKKKPGSGK